MSTHVTQPPLARHSPILQGFLRIPRTPESLSTACNLFCTQHGLSTLETAHGVIRVRIHGIRRPVFPTVSQLNLPRSYPLIKCPDVYRIGRPNQITRIQALPISGNSSLLLVNACHIDIPSSQETNTLDTDTDMRLPYTDIPVPPTRPPKTRETKFHTQTFC